VHASSVPLPASRPPATLVEATVASISDDRPRTKEFDGSRPAGFPLAVGAHALGYVGRASRDVARRQRHAPQPPTAQSPPGGLDRPVPHQSRAFAGRRASVSAGRSSPPLWTTTGSARSLIACRVLARPTVTPAITGLEAGVVLAGIVSAPQPTARPGSGVLLRWPIWFTGAVATRRVRTRRWGARLGTHPARSPLASSPRARISPWPEQRRTGSRAERERSRACGPRRVPSASNVARRRDPAN
jgi:hypothetical protein